MNDHARIAFLGDISLNDDYRTMYQKKLNPFKDIEPIIKNCDLVVGNLECFLQGIHGENVFKKPRLHTDVNTLNYLKNINLGLACLANNHVYDNLEDGFQKTLDYLESNKIAHMGASIKKDASIPYFFFKEDIKIAILNYVTEDTNPKISSNAKLKLNIFDRQRAINEIKSIKILVDHLVVFIHWGGKMEGAMYPDIEQPKLARQLIDAGADVIMGHHPHTLQPFEIYQGKYIFYSIGNFCFADVVFEGKQLELDKRRTDSSIIVCLDFYKSKYSVQMHGILNINGIITPCNSVTKKIKQLIYHKCLIYKKPVWFIYLFFEKRIYPVLSFFFSNQRNPIKQLTKIKLNSVKKYFMR